MIRIIFDRWQEKLLMSILVLLGLPSFSIKWSLIDDWFMIKMVKTMSEAIGNLKLLDFLSVFMERENGRFRPAYWIYNWLVYLIGHTNADIFYFFHIVTIILIALLIYWVIYKVSTSKTAALVGSLLFALSSANVENWYRLGTLETLFCLFLLMSIVFLIKAAIGGAKISKWEKLSFLFLFAAYLTKETAFVMLFITVFTLLGLIIVRKSKLYKVDPRIILLLRNFLFVNILLSILLAFIVYPLKNTGAYSVNYNVNFSQMKQNLYLYFFRLRENFPIFLFLLPASYLIRNFFKFVNKKKFVDLPFVLQAMFAVWFLAFLFAQLPWPYVLERYLMPSLVGLTVFFGIEIAHLLRLARKYFGGEITAVILSLSVVPFLWYSVPRYINYLKVRVIENRVFYDMSGFIVSHSPANAVLYLNLVESEATTEIPKAVDYYLEYFQNRPDLSTKYLNKLANKRGKDSLIISGLMGGRYKIYSSEELEKLPWAEKAGQFSARYFVTNLISFNKLPLVAISYLYRPNTPSSYKLSENEMGEIDWSIFKIY